MHSYSAKYSALIKAFIEAKASGVLSVVWIKAHEQKEVQRGLKHEVQSKRCPHGWMD